jgi:glycosyltransferase involved in cell wall biosynthesis
VAPPVSVVMTVLDDREGLAETLSALHAQQADLGEVLIVDAGSRDGSAHLAAYWRDRGLPVRWLELPGAGISAGRNHGIGEARHDHVVVTDAGCRPVPGWAAALREGLARADFVSGVYRVDTTTPLEHAVAAALYPCVDEIEGCDLPTRVWHRLFGRRFTVTGATGRSMAFRRATWRRAGGFPEQVNAGEDVAFASAAVDGGADALLEPRALVSWRGRPTWRENAQMYYAYAHGDAFLGRRSRAFARALAWTVFAGLALRRRTAPASVAWLVVYCSIPVRRALRTGLAPRHLWRIPVALALKDLCMIAGSAAGDLERRSATRSPDAEQQLGRQA